MDVSWTAQSTFPDRLYRVWRPLQVTQHQTHGPQAGVVAADQRVAYLKNDIPAFVASLVSHRNQDRIKSPYISLFEDLGEARAWCMAAEDTFEHVSYIIALDLKSVAFQNGLANRTIHGFRVGDVVKELKLEEKALGTPSGPNRMDSEWMFVYKLPGSAFCPGTQNSRDIREELRFPRPPKPITCSCEGEAARHGEPHFCLDMPMVGVKGGGKLGCGCKSEELCVHFDWNLDDRAAMY
ncbi:uncharacterized protein PAC_17211 [Phialocephala subalpina]|uniref:DUF7587 domain-containing protein n=1 Tax=Phialocephala subalpina TaxID=576137 RepID=A0A1L7XQI6_9HELO|nr:uncharacterized protein PAC_17211 [Phialocephala subalpina]